MNILLQPTNFPTIATFVAIVNAERVFFEVCDNYQKQTYRNRTYIFGANGKLALTVPVIYTQKKRQLTKEVKIANVTKWQAINWKSILSAYSTSPFFEYYKDELKTLFINQEEHILDYNLKCLNFILDCLQISPTIEFTVTYEKTSKHSIDLRSIANIKNPYNVNFEPYTQVFNQKHGFLNNLSILDLLFNEGPNALNYLETQKLFW